MRKQKIYLETTLFNHYFDDDRGIAHASTVALFKEIAACKYEAFTSSMVIEELYRAETEKYEKMFSLISKYNIAVINVSEEAEKLADVYVFEQIIPQKYRADGVHIAVATVNDLDIIISMNFQHIVKRKTKIGIGSINALNGYRNIDISSPMEVVENEIN